MDLIKIGPKALAIAQEALSSTEGYPLSEVTLKVSIFRPGKLMVVGGNYYSHLEELRRVPALTHLSEITHQVWFNKQTSAIADHVADVILPELAKEVDFEVEMAVVVGRECSKVTVADAGNYIFGYTVANDISARDLHGKVEPCLSKSLDGFAPLGPWIVTADEIPNPQGLAIKSYLNGKIRQNSSTGDMIHSCAELVAYLSGVVTLEPGGKRRKHS